MFLSLIWYYKFQKEMARNDFHTLKLKILILHTLKGTKEVVEETIAESS